MIPKTEYVTEWFKRAGRPGAGTSASRLSLAAFGKHPGWEDHIPGIGVDTEALANLKQSLYFDGIRGQIDSGAWEKMEQLKRIEGFDHVFLWLHPGRVLLGLMWSSSDRIGRAKYPMILCADGEGISPAFMLAHAKPELERLRDTCKAATSAETVTAECRAALDRLKGTFERAGDGWAEPFSDAVERQRFLDCPELAPDRAGFLRILHEYSTEQGTSSEKNAKHLRVPIINSLQMDAFTPWIEFFRCIVPSKVSALFIKRNGEAWLDVIVGEPASRDFFCLQAAVEALPLTTQVPYEISEQTISALNAVVARLGLSPAPVKQQSRAQAPARSIPAPAVPVHTGARRGIGPLIIIGVIVIVIFAAVAAILFLKAGNPAPKGAPESPAKPATSAPATVAGQNYETAIQSASDAFEKGDYDQAIRQANLALQYAPGDPTAAQIKTEAMNKKRDGEAQDRSYTVAMTAAKNALSSGKYDEAMKQVRNALVARPGDGAAMTLNTTIEDRQGADAEGRRKNYGIAKAKAQDALTNGNYGEAIRQAQAALTFEAGDPDANNLLAQAQSQQEEQQQRQRYNAAMQAARQAYDDGNDQLAIQQVNAALAARPDDTDAAALKAKAESAQSAGQAYQAAMQAARAAFNSQSYDVAIKQADTALANRPGDTAALALKTDATLKWNAQASGRQDQSEINAVDAAWSTNGFDAVILHANLALQISPDQPDIKAKLRDSVHNELQIYGVWFGAINPQDANYSPARKLSPLPQGNIDPNWANDCKKRIDGWLKILGNYQLANDADTKLAQEIKKNINQY